MSMWEPSIGASDDWHTPDEVIAAGMAAGRIKLHDQGPGSRWLEQVTA